MSRIGKRPITIPDGVTADLSGSTITARGPKGELSFCASDQVVLKMSDGSITVEPANDTKTARSFWGMSRTMIENLMIGVKDGYTKNLEINGVGFRAAMKGSDLEMSLGFSHPVVYTPPENITIKCAKPTEIEISGFDKQVVGQVAAEIRSFRPPEPYKGKGIKYSDEYIFRKEGKKK